jgi:hypothetical protein
MSKKLKDFKVRVNLDGWWIRRFGACHQGQEVNGTNIPERMIIALETKETFRLGSAETPVCVLYGGTVAELRAAYDGARLSKKGPSVPVQNKPPELLMEKPVPAPLDEPVEEDEEEEEPKEPVVEKVKLPPLPPPPADDDDEDEEEEEEEVVLKTKPKPKKVAKKKVAKKTKRRG